MNLVHLRFRLDAQIDADDAVRLVRESGYSRAEAIRCIRAWMADHLTGAIRRQCVTVRAASAEVQPPFTRRQYDVDPIHPAHGEHPHMPMTSTFDLPASVRELCLLSKVTGNALIPRGTSKAAMLRIFKAALAGQDRYGIADVAGTEFVEDGFRKIRLCDHDFSEIVRWAILVRRERDHQTKIIEDAETRREHLDRLLDPKGIK